MFWRGTFDVGAFGGCSLCIGGGAYVVLKWKKRYW